MMRRLLVAFAVLAILLCSAETKRKGPKLPDVQVVEAKARRTESQVLVDGRFRNTSSKTLNHLNLLFDFLSTDNEVVTTKRYLVEEDSIRSLKESEFRLYLVDPVRAVSFQIRAETSGGKELTISNAGPFPVE
jgi:hypothetical protein